MPFYLRKSISAGPFRFNFSNGGLGVSVGVKGLRIGSGPRGHYVHAGRAGIYYRATLGKVGERGSRLPPDHDNKPRFAPTPQPSGTTMVEVESGDVLQMRDASFDDLLDELNTVQRHASMAALIGGITGAIGLVALFSGAGPALLLAVIPAWAVGSWLDSYGRKVVLYYELDETAERAYQAVTQAFDALTACNGKWHIEAGGTVTDLTTWKRNAGATHIIRKKPTTLSYATPSIVKSNLNPPALRVGKQVIYILPDVALIQDSNRFGAVSYSDLSVVYQTSNFIEERGVPTDAKVVGHTWKHPNKSGGPDRRFKHNYQIPICQYEVMHLRCASGINELLEFSKIGVVHPFVRALKSLPSQRIATSTRLAKANPEITR